MRKVGYLMAAAAVALTAAWPPAGVSAQTAAPETAAPAGQYGTMPMMGMPGMMGMQGMGMMPMMGVGGPGMGMIDHVEGRIAFLRTELKITDAQTDTWNEFANALRSNATALRPLRMAMMGGDRPQNQTLTQRLDAQERWLSARLEGTRALKTAYEKLNAVLTSEQQATADELLAPHMGMGMGLRMGMGPMAQRGPMGRRAR